MSRDVNPVPEHVPGTVHSRDKSLGVLVVIAAECVVNAAISCKTPALTQI